MPVRNRIFLKKGSRGGSGSSGGHKKIVIRPYKLPPQLPPNYYESTVQDLLQVTMAVLDQNRPAFGTIRSSSYNSNNNNNDQSMMDVDNNNNNRPPASSKLSLQNAYTAVVHLVSHQYGPRLYHDLRKSMQVACEKVLDPSVVSSSSQQTAAEESLLRIIPVLYQSYTEYLLCVKHVFLPLDRTHVWQSDTQQVLPLRGGAPESTTTTATTTTTSSGFSLHAQQTLWQVGLAVWADRLVQLGIDTLVYQGWLQSLLAEWNPGKGHAVAAAAAVVKEEPDWNMNTSLASTGAGASSSSSTPNLQLVWYMWQDLGWLSNLPLQGDLEQYWKKESQSWESEIPYRPVTFLSFAYHKHQNIHTWPWLPSTWLMSIIEHCLLQPHLMIITTTSNNNNSNNTESGGDGMAAVGFLNNQKKTILPLAGLLLQPENFSPLLEEAMFGDGGNSTTIVHGRGGAGDGTISKLWMLAGRIPHGQAMVARSISQFARSQGLARVQGPTATTTATTTTSTKKPPNSTTKDPVAQSIGAVGGLLQLQRALADLIRSLPQGSELINLKNVWEEVVNQDTKPSVAESLAKFLDAILRNNKKMDQYQQESDHWLVKIISGVFVPLQAKDIFEAFYKRDLAKRLLWNRVVSMDVEKQVCSLLKAECGAAYTSKMEGMFQDVDWSRETMMVYKQSLSSSGAPGSSSSSNMEMEVQVLTTGYWPVYPQYPNLQLSESLREQQEHFSNHYKTKYQGRRMTWQYALGHCVVKCSGFARPYELIVSLCQAVVLQQFKTNSKWTLVGLMKAAGLEDRDEMERILQSLSLGKEGTRILRKLDHDADPSVKRKIRTNVDDTKDLFTINESFESNQRRIRIQNIMMKETKEEHDKTVEAVSRDRLYLIDAVLVRIMKARKTILHQTLIPQVLEQVKVPAQPADVKKRIESLIEREYMERDAKDRNRYNYLA